jgi:hypothetical protein
MATREPWIYPVARCPACGRGFEAREELIAHQFDRGHWRPLPPPDPAEAATLREALAAAEARRQQKADGDERALSL